MKRGIDLRPGDTVAVGSHGPGRYATAEVATRTLTPTGVRLQLVATEGGRVVRLPLELGPDHLVAQTAAEAFELERDNVVRRAR